MQPLHAFAVDKLRQQQRHSIPIPVGRLVAQSLLAHRGWLFPCAEQPRRAFERRTCEAGHHETHIDAWRHTRDDSETLCLTSRNVLRTCCMSSFSPACSSSCFHRHELLKLRGCWVPESLSSCFPKDESGWYAPGKETRRVLHRTFMLAI